MPPARFVASRGPTSLDLRIAAVCPTQLLQCLPERCNAGLAFGIVCGYGHKNTDPPHAITLLRPRRDRPRRRPADQRDEFAPPDHSITSSAVASSLSGICNPSALAATRLITRSNLVGCSTGISAGFAPRSTLSTNSAARRNRSGKFGPYDIKPPGSI